MKKLALLLLLLSCNHNTENPVEEKEFEKKNWNCQVYYLEQKQIIVCDR